MRKQTKEPVNKATLLGLAKSIPFIREYDIEHIPQAIRDAEAEAEAYEAKLMADKKLKKLVDRADRMRKQWREENRRRNERRVKLIQLIQLHGPLPKLVKEVEKMLGLKL